MQIALTGVTVFVGYYIAQKLTQEGHRLRWYILRRSARFG
jgi:nucleoside-diphosphate-sugar epimerase